MQLKNELKERELDLKEREIELNKKLKELSSEDFKNE
jgi:hypothetical protein